MKGKRKLSVKWKVFAYFAGFTAIMLVLLWVFQIGFLEDVYRATKIHSIKKSAREIARNIDSDTLEQQVLDMGQAGEMCVDIYNDRYTSPVLRSHTEPGCLLHNLPLSYISGLYRLAAENGGSYYVTLNLNDFLSAQGYVNAPRTYDSLIYVLVTQNAAGDNMVIFLNAFVTPVAATIQTLTTVLSIITVVLIFVAAALAFVLSRVIAKPIARLNDSAKALATGNYDADFSGGGYREIAELSETLRYAAQELSKVDEYRRDLIANVSHDLRTPLTLIAGYAEVMQDIPSENTPENLQIIVNESKRLTDLVNDVLDISNYQAGNMELNLSRFNLTDAVREILGRYKKFTEQDGYTISLLADGDYDVCADQIKITQVLYNLLNNAIAYTGEDKKITIRVRRSGSAVRVDVIDTGEGIPPEKLGMIWDRYYKLDKAHKRAKIGTGLGLSIVKEIIEQHGAWYGVDSQVGVGSQFWFALPLAAEEEL